MDSSHRLNNQEEKAMTYIYNGYRIQVNPAVTNPNSVIITVVHIADLRDVGFAPSVNAAMRLADFDTKR